MKNERRHFCLLEFIFQRENTKQKLHLIQKTEEERDVDTRTHLSDLEAGAEHGSLDCALKHNAS